MFTSNRHTTTPLIISTNIDAFPPNLIEQTTRSVTETFAKICGSEVSIHEEATGCPDRVKIVGIISFVGDLMWSLALILPHDSAEEIARKFAGFDIPFESADMGDVVGELINVLAGVVSGNLETVGINSQMSLPTVARGDAFELMLPENLVSRRLHFSTTANDFLIEITAIRPH
jgi:CheY-specific phosphatase CheX